MDEMCSVLHSEDGRIIGVQYPRSLDNIEGFIELLQRLESKIRYFDRYDLVLAIPIGFGIASVLLNNPMLDNYPFIRLTIREDFPNLSDGRRNRLLDELCTRYPVWLGNLGSGTSNMMAVMEGCFDCLVMDRKFTQGNAEKAIFPSVLNEINKYTNNLIVPGINTGRYRPVRLKHIEKLM